VTPQRSSDGHGSAGVVHEVRPRLYQLCKHNGRAGHVRAIWHTHAGWHVVGRYHVVVNGHVGFCDLWRNCQPLYATA